MNEIILAEQEIPIKKNIKKTHASHWGEMVVAYVKYRNFFNKNTI